MHLELQARGTFWHQGIVNNYYYLHTLVSADKESESYLSQKTLQKR